MGVPSDYFVSTQLQLWLFCCWGCGCCWAVTTIEPAPSRLLGRCVKCFSYLLKFIPNILFSSFISDKLQVITVTEVSECRIACEIDIGCNGIEFSAGLCNMFGGLVKIAGRLDGTTAAILPCPEI